MKHEKRVTFKKQVSYFDTGCMKTIYNMISWTRPWSQSIWLAVVCEREGFIPKHAPVSDATGFPISFFFFPGWSSLVDFLRDPDSFLLSGSVLTSLSLLVFSSSSVVLNTSSFRDFMGIFNYSNPTRHLQAISDPQVAPKIINNSQPNSVLWKKKFASSTLKGD